MPAASPYGFPPQNSFFPGSGGPPMQHNPFVEAFGLIPKSDQPDPTMAWSASQPVFTTADSNGKTSDKTENK